MSPGEGQPQGSGPPPPRRGQVLGLRPRVGRAGAVPVGSGSALPPVTT